MDIAFPAMRGRMGAHEYYVAMIQLGDVASIFENYLDKKINQAQTQAEIDLFEEAQRRMNLKRIPEIRDYILNHPDNWVFSALTASYKEATFRPFTDGLNIGTLHFKNFSKFTINDGQHRCAALREALLAHPELEDQSISVVFFKADTVLRMQQIFTDLNRSAAKVSGSVVIAMGNLPIERVTVEVVSAHPFLKHYTDMERASPTLRSEKIFALSSLYQAHMNLVGKQIPPQKIPETIEELTSFWNDLYGVMVPWQKVAEGKMTAAELKENYICHHAMILRALATLLRLSKQAGGDCYERSLSQIGALNWRKKDRFWQGKAINPQGCVINNRGSESFLVASLRSKFGLMNFGSHERRSSTF
jgi:DNA sulfur modification protein DndB